MQMKTREDALRVLQQYNETESLLKHAYAVEGVMRRFAAARGEDVAYWGQVGLLHDVDYERWPNEHLKIAPRLLAEAGYDEAFIRAVCAHGYGICTDVKPELPMEQVLYTIDELTGLIGAVAIMRPSKSVGDLELKSVKKKYKTANFAAGCSREVIDRGAQMLGWSLDELIERTILAMRATPAASWN